MERQPFYLRRPTLVRQRQPMSCWAAALESWLSVCRPGAPYTEAWALQTFSRWQAGDARIEWTGLKAVADLFSMRSEVAGMGALTPDYLDHRLHSGHVYLTYIPTPGPVAAHTVVVYGIGTAAVDVMDPLEGYVSRPHEFFETRTRALVGWPSGAGGVIPDPTGRVNWFIETGVILP
jgi:hypothetical protein